MLDRVKTSQLHRAQAQLPQLSSSSLMLPPSSLQALVAVAVLLSLGMCWATALSASRLLLACPAHADVLDWEAVTPNLGSMQLVSRLCSPGSEP